jgi:hypothetical protein
MSIEKAKHTPGPWKHWPKRDRPLVTSEDGKTPICRTISDDAGGPADAPPYHQAEANARLIAAAPDLLAACEEALTLPLEEALGLSGGHYVARLLREAIAKAKAT